MIYENMTIDRLEAQVKRLEAQLAQAKTERDNAARNTTTRIAERIEALAEYHSVDRGYSAGQVLAALAVELRAGGGGE